MKINADKVFVGLIVAFCLSGIALVSLVVYNAHLQEKAEQSFIVKCASACFPNAVYSTEHKRCMCNAIVTVREIQ